MDAEKGGVFFGQREEDVVIEGDLGVDGPFFCPSSICSVTPTTLEEWALDPQCGLNDSEAEDVLHAINPNDVFPPGPPGECFSESDSGASEDPLSDSSPEASELAQPPTAIYQVVYDIGRLNNIKTEPKQQSVDVISIELDEWSSQMLISESCVVNELPLVPTGKPDDAPSTAAVSEDAHNLENVPFYPDLHLTEEEQKLLTQEGISLPSNLPLTKAEERILKKVRRKIRNKQSAQDSRRRKKEYIDGLETRVTTCSLQNQELQRTVEQLEKHNLSLMTQLRKLQSLIKQTATKAAQTTTCIMILIFSLTLIIFPSYSPFSYNSVSEEQGYTPTGVISRNILTDPASSSQISEDVDDTVIHPDVLSYLPDSNQSDPPGLTSGVLQQTMENPERVLHESLAQEENRSKNVSTAIEEQAKLMPMGLVSAKTQDSTKTDAAKPAHADEM
ncbi:cyclic AMP-responsive element-binding protein 3-like protein 4 [Scleropages formosus]|uniref:Cyclic AMP-responsive element-binding protein 3-like protein 4 n=1 Tax=Scleropages formosus TaxID=113540 RepID=A0A8C9RK29_SCLFO|nr:cyclic AMP-responsive element-binding protein 3-like protein 4 [Scleropages formosus]